MCSGDIVCCRYTSFFTNARSSTNPIRPSGSSSGTNVADRLIVAHTYRSLALVAFASCCSLILKVRFVVKLRLCAEVRAGFIIAVKMLRFSAMLLMSGSLTAQQLTASSPLRIGQWIPAWIFSPLVARFAQPAIPLL